MRAPALDPRPRRHFFYRALCRRRRRLVYTEKKFAQRERKVKERNGVGQKGLLPLQQLFSPLYPVCCVYIHVRAGPDRDVALTLFVRSTCTLSDVRRVRV